jgi:hypothetical protein
MLVLVALSQVLRWWCVATLGPRWSTLVIVVPQAPLIRRGPYRWLYRWLHHPNYVAVVVEGMHAGQRAVAHGADPGGKRSAGLQLTYDADLLIVGGGPSNGFLRRSHVFAQIAAAEPASGFGQLKGETAEVVCVK